MKKLLIYLLLAAMILSFVACKNDDTKPKEEEKIYTFTSSTTKIAIDAEAAPILEALGTWRAYDESASCAFEGLDKIYTYDGFEITTYPLNGKDYIFLIEFYDDTVATEEGIRIGSTKADVIATYGTPDEETANALIYNGKGMFLQILFDEDAVFHIQYFKETEQ